MDNTPKISNNIDFAKISMPKEKAEDKQPDTNLNTKKTTESVPLEKSALNSKYRKDIDKTTFKHFNEKEDGGIGEKLVTFFANIVKMIERIILGRLNSKSSEMELPKTIKIKTIKEKEEDLESFSFKTNRNKFSDVA